jgi:hypothetical protein
VDVSNNEATTTAEGGPGLVHMMQIAVTGSMGQVATSLIELHPSNHSTRMLHQMGRNI